jgi:hydroxylamine reductase
MFCYQCEQTAKGTGCTYLGVCGKDGTTATLQDLLVHASKGIAMYTHRARQLGSSDRTLDRFIVEALFTTVTNVNFDPARMWQWLHRAVDTRNRAMLLYNQACARAGKPAETLGGPAAWVMARDLTALSQQGEEVGILKRREKLDPDVASLQELLVYGLKGTAAYAEHARVLGYEDDAIYASFAEHLNYLTEAKQTVPELLRRCLDAGALNLKVMELLDKANTTTFGHPAPAQVRVEPVKGKAILVSGHDLLDLKKLLEQTEGKGINI